MSRSRYHFFDRDQWGRIAEYWRATKGALPAPCVEEGDRVLEHWYESGQGEPPADYLLVDGDGKILRWVGLTTMQWVHRLFADAMLRSWPPAREPRSRRESELMREMDRLWH